jgi:hypothetical protein
MTRRKRIDLVEEFWESANPPVSLGDETSKLFNELSELMSPKTYVGKGIVRELVDTFYKFLE